MSKELEALEVLGNTVIHHIDSCGNITNNKVSNSNEFKLIKQALTPPTSDEVCKALSKYFKQEVRNIDGAFCYLYGGQRIVLFPWGGQVLFRRPCIRV